MCHIIEKCALKALFYILLPRMIHGSVNTLSTIKLAQLRNEKFTFAVKRL